MFLDEISRKRLALAMAGTILLSGLSGFGGTYIANSLNGPDSAKYASLSVISATSPSDSVFPGGNSSRLANVSNLRLGGTLTIPEIAALASDSVVEISTEIVSTNFRMLQLISQGAGSGVIVSADGYIVTNNHVIEGANKITVTLNNGQPYNATLIGRDTKTDLAVLKINAQGLRPAVIGNSDELVVGDVAVAIGNPLGQLGGTVTEGIISALNRDIVIDGLSMNLLQTSAAINPGNSGGGLFNVYGELIAIVNAKSSGSDIEGLGFAIPISPARDIIEQIIRYGYVQGRIDLGVTLVDVSDFRSAMLYRVQYTGVYVLKAEPGNVLQSGDRIISIDGKSVQSAAEVKTIVEQYRVGDSLTTVVQRGNQHIELNLTLKQAKY